jgi:hypothetical protein
MQIQDAIERLRVFLKKYADAPPPPRWQVIVASVYFGMLIYLLVYRSGILFH